MRNNEKSKKCTITQCLKEMKVMSQMSMGFVDERVFISLPSCPSLSIAQDVSCWYFVPHDYSCRTR